jgi:hypothetical protein
MQTYLQREIEFEPGYDKRNPDPDKNYGIHGMNMRFLLKGKLGTVQLLIYTNWQVPSVNKNIDQFEKVSRFLIEPMAADIGYHSRIPQYEGQNPIVKTRFKSSKPKKIKLGEEEIEFPGIEIDREFTPEPCPYLNNDPCFYDGSSLSAKRYFEVFVEKGEEALWEELESYYNRALAIEASWLRIFNIVRQYDIDESAPIWFYIYKHQNGGWERSGNFVSKTAVLWDKFKTHCRVLYKKFRKKF